jgi:hypothetical protein
MSCFSGNIMGGVAQPNEPARGFTRAAGPACPCRYIAACKTSLLPMLVEQFFVFTAGLARKLASKAKPNRAVFVPCACR